MVGLLTGIHCVSMCEAINSVTVINKNQTKNIKKPLLYNMGRVISYTLIGALIGFIGSVLSINKILLGIVIILAALIMFIISLNMIGVFNALRLRKYKED